MLATRRALYLASAALLLLPLTARAQDIGSNLESLAQDNAELYVAPVFEGLANALNTGFLRTPDVHDRFGFDVGVRAMIALVPDEANTFVARPPSQFTATVGGVQRTYADPLAPRGGSLETPTAVGEGPGIVLEPSGEFRDDLIAAGESPDEFNVLFPEGFDVPAVPFAVISAGLGIGWGTEVSVRFIPDVDVNDDVGSLGAFGFGVTHQVNQWFPAPVPVDLAGFVGYQNFNVGDYLDASTTTFGVSVGKGFGPLSLYGVGQIESPSADLEYAASNPTGNPALPSNDVEISFSPELDGGPRFGIGFIFDMVVFQIAGEYSLGDYDAVTARASIGFR